MPDRETGWSVQMMYDEPDFALTVQTVAWSPQRVSSVHNHATWGIVALIDGEEKNTFWQRSPSAEFPDRIVKTGEHILTSGDILCLMPEAIHQVEAIGDEPTISFNIYGITDYTTPSIYLTLSLGITFPFNLAIGIPLYIWLAEVLT